MSDRSPAEAASPRLKLAHRNKHMLILEHESNALLFANSMRRRLSGFAVEAVLLVQGARSRSPDLGVVNSIAPPANPSR